MLLIILGLYIQNKRWLNHLFVSKEDTFGYACQTLNFTIFRNLILQDAKAINTAFLHVKGKKPNDDRQHSNCCFASS